MKKFLTLILFSGHFLNIYCQNPDFLWAKSIHNASGGQYHAGTHTIDGEGNVILVGNFSGTIDFDPGAGITNRVSEGFSDIFIQKLDKNGQLLWATSIGGNCSDFGNFVETDDSNNIFVAGDFGYFPIYTGFVATVDFDPGPGTAIHNSGGNFDIYLLKLDANGNFSWVKTYGGLGDESVSSLAIEPTGEIYLTGSFERTVDFDPGPGTSLLKSNGFYDIFILKADVNGNLLWAKSIGNESQDNEWSSDIAIDPAGNVLISGAFFETMDFDPGIDSNNLTAIGKSDNFILKMNTTGDFVWAKSIGSIVEERGNSIHTDALGNLIISGNFWYETDFDPGSGYFTVKPKGKYGTNDFFIEKLDADGKFLWVKFFGGPENDGFGSIAADHSGNLYLTGNFSDTLRFPSGSGIPDLTSIGDRDILILKLNPYGEPIWASSMGGIYDEGGGSVSIDLQGNLVVSGGFLGNCDFDPGPGVQYMTTDQNLSETFIVKLKNAEETIAQDAEPHLLFFPNPAREIFQIRIEAQTEMNLDIRICDLLGREIAFLYSGLLENGNFVQSIDCSSIAPGRYFIVVSNHDSGKLEALPFEKL